MRIVCMADTHSSFEDQGTRMLPVPEGDLLIHAGDATLEGRIGEVDRHLRWMSSLPHRHKVMIAGNHDFLFEMNSDLARSMVPRGITYLQDEEVEIEGLRIYGSPWTPRFFNWAFNLDRGLPLEAAWSRIPEGIDILVTHGPPFGILDFVQRGEHAGCKDLRDAVERIKPRLHVFGHIHSGHGYMALGGTTFVNASIVNEAYDPVWEAFTIDL